MKDWMIEYSAASVRGQRTDNQDNLRVGSGLPWADVSGDFSVSGVLDDRKYQLVCVCDGIGGGFMGDCASFLALQAVEDVASTPDAMEKGLEQLVQEAAEAAHYAVSSFMHRLGRPGGCTLTLVGLSEGRFCCLNIGDSPCFLLPKGKNIEELSIRHNLYWHKVRMQIEPDPQDASMLMRFLGKANCSVSLMADRISGTLEPGDMLLLCSDGVTNKFGPDELTDFLRSGVGAEELVKEAAVLEKADNSTAVVLRVCGQRNM